MSFFSTACRRPRILHPYVLKEVRHAKYFDLVHQDGMSMFESPGVIKCEEDLSSGICMCRSYIALERLGR